MSSQNTNSVQDAASQNGSTASQSRGVTCAACHEKNSVDSRFCRHCGAALAAPQTPSVQAPAPQAPVAANAAQDGSEEKSSPAEIDGRRARQLLDRALALSDKGDKAGAILACRQAVSLAPQVVAGYAMLGPLLERSGDVAGAMAAYERVLAIAPNSPIERDSLARLRAAASQSSAARNGNLFNFDEGELFQTSTAPVADQPAPVAPKPVAIAPAAVASAAVAPVAVAPAAVAPAAATPRPASAANAAPQANAAARPAPTQSVPSQVAPSPRPQSPAPMTVPPISATPMSAVSPSLLINEPAVPDVPRWVRAIRGENSFWMQSAPLAVTALAGLGFLLWARNVAALRVAATPVVIAVPENSDSAQPQPAPENTGQTTPVANAPIAPGDTVSNVRPRLAAPAAPAAPPQTAPRVATSTAPRPATRPGSTRIAAAPPRDVRPAPRDGGARPQVPATPARPFDGMAPPRLNPPTPAERVFTAPSVPSGSSTGGAPLNPAGSGTRGYIRVTGPRPAPPARPDSRSTRAEEAAREAARAGRTGSAISSATASIEGGRDAGWRFQQRALLFLEQGDNARAADDFRTAISVYRDQINRNINVEQARSGLDACQNGLRLAQLRLR